MKTFQCACGARIFFENTACLRCGRELGFLVNQGIMSAVAPNTPDRPGGYKALADSGAYKKCKNYVVRGICNWMIPEGDGNEFCQACRLNRIIPDLSIEESRVRWARVETAKRRLLYEINSLGLPVVPQSEHPEGLAFDIKADTPNQRVLTGHADGLITLNLAEADPVLREIVKRDLDERYRTLLGHFRHEVGHYYWDVIIKNGPWHESFRALFGDEQTPYGDALRRHYENPRQDWAEHFISAYASAHPWEDWAETWAHYLHMVDTLETAGHFGFQAPPWSLASTLQFSFDAVLDAWLELTVVLNELNRSMGMPDPYPFELGPKASEKLAFAHRVIAEHDGSLPAVKDR